jgi:hypothetical protein
MNPNGNKGGNSAQSSLQSTSLSVASSMVSPGKQKTLRHSSSLSPREGARGMPTSKWRDEEDDEYDDESLTLNSPR